MPFNMASDEARMRGALPVFVVAVILLAGCSSAPTPRGAPAMSCGQDPAFTDSMGGFGYCFPAEWTRRDVGNFAVFLSPLEGSSDAFQENVNMVWAPVGGRTLKEYVDSNIKALEGSLEDYYFLKRGAFPGAMVLGEQIEYTGTQGTYTLHWVQTYWVHDGLGYVLSYTAQHGHEETFRADANNVTLSVRFV